MLAAPAPRPSAPAAAASLERRPLACAGQGDADPAHCAARPLEDHGAAVIIASPDPNRVYRVDPGLPRNVQQLPIMARLSDAARAGGATVTLLVDGAELAVVAGPDYTAWWPLTAGSHTFEAMVVAADGTRIRSAAVNVLVEE